MTGQYYLRARYYNPVVGRFLQEDVYRGDGLNLYTYCDNNPVVNYDSSGEAKKRSRVKTKKTGGEHYTRFMSISEANKIIKNRGLVPIESGGNASRAAVWISEQGKERDAAGLGGKAGSHGIEVDFTTNPGVNDSLLNNSKLYINYESQGSGGKIETSNPDKIFHKDNEQGSYGIGRDRLDDFNNELTHIKVKDAKTGKVIEEVDIPENKKNTSKNDCKT